MDQCFGMLAASRSTFALKKLDLRDQSPVELAHPLASQPFELFQAPLALSDEPRDVHTEGLRLELPEALGTVAEQARCPAPVAVLLVVEADTNLEDALVEEADPPGLLHPGLLEVLVALVQLAPVELLYAPEGELGELLWGLQPLAAAATSTATAATARHARVHNGVGGEGRGARRYGDEVGDHTPRPL